jgi:biopolymer transport protein ExbD
MKTASVERKIAKLHKIGAAIIIISMLVFSGFSKATAQTKRTKAPARKKILKKKKSATRQTPSVMMGEITESVPTSCVPPFNDNVSLIEINKNSNITVTVKTQDSTEIIASNKPVLSLKQVLSGLDKNSVITIKPDPDLSFGSVAKILYEIRRVTNECANIETSTDVINPYVHYTAEPKDSDFVVKPYPLLLVVEIKSDKKITLNRENEGSLSETSLLTRRLAEIFKDRENNGVFREGTNEVEKTVFVKAAVTLKFSDVIKAINAVKLAGASPVGLQIDDLDGMAATPNPPMLMKKR